MGTPAGPLLGNGGLYNRPAQLRHLTGCQCPPLPGTQSAKLDRAELDPTEAPDRVEPDVIRHEVRDDRSALWVADGRDVAAWLVDEDVVERFGTRQRRAVDRHDIHRGIGQRGQLADHRAVDRDTALGDEAL